MTLPDRARQLAQEVCIQDDNEGKSVTLLNPYWVERALLLFGAEMIEALKVNKKRVWVPDEDRNGVVFIEMKDNAVPCWYLDEVADELSKAAGKEL